jgi:BirA family transcriptional regulator, biotin operon repressor / biotin---[acetyl-CoA-carboxylase] ligase
MESPIEVWNLPNRHIGRQVLIFESLTSTNDYALANRASLESGTVIQAHRQTAGRGQYGRSWASPVGAGGWISIVLHPVDLIRPAIWTAWAAVSIAEAIRPLINHQPHLKWPNDVLVTGRKVCGILIEQSQCTVVGIGLNVNQSETQLVADKLPEATSLAILANHHFRIDEVTRLIIQQLDNEYDVLVNGDLGILEACWKSQLGLLGRTVVVELIDGKHLHGHLKDLSFAGLELEMNDGELVRLVPEQVRQMGETQENTRQKTA